MLRLVLAHVASAQLVRTGLRLTPPITDNLYTTGSALSRDDRFLYVPINKFNDPDCIRVIRLPAAEPFLELCGITPLRQFTTFVTSPDGQDLYGSGYRGTLYQNQIQHWRMLSNGSLVTGDTVRAPASTGSLSISPDGRHLYTFGHNGPQNDHFMFWSYTRDTTSGRLTLFENHLGLGRTLQKSFTAVSADGRTVYVAGGGGSTATDALIMVYTRDPNTGSVELRATVTEAGGAFSGIVSVINPQPGAVSLYTADTEGRIVGYIEGGGVPIKYEGYELGFTLRTSIAGETGTLWADRESLVWMFGATIASFSRHPGTGALERVSHVTDDMMPVMRFMAVTRTHVYTGLNIYARVPSSFSSSSTTSPQVVTNNKAAAPISTCRLELANVTSGEKVGCDVAIHSQHDMTYSCIANPQTGLSLEIDLVPTYGVRDERLLAFGWIDPQQASYTRFNLACQYDFLTGSAPFECQDSIRVGHRYGVVERYNLFPADRLITLCRNTNNCCVIRSGEGGECDGQTVSSQPELCPNKWHLSVPGLDTSVCLPPTQDAGKFSQYIQRHGRSTLYTLAFRVHVDCQ